MNSLFVLSGKHVGRDYFEGIGKVDSIDGIEFEVESKRVDWERFGFEP